MESDPGYGPAASLAALRHRAAILAWVREFFRERGVLEVETPLLGAAGSVDEHLDPIQAGGRYLMTSPEHAMKRLLAAGSGPIFQITRAFRDGERGRLHNPEFTILEWYRTEFDHLDLMDEVETLVAGALERFGAAGADAPRPFHRLTYREAFQRSLGVDPHAASLGDLELLARREGAAPPCAGEGRDSLLNLLLAARVEPGLGLDRPAFVFAYPASQASSARIAPGDPPLAERFELYLRGVELANGYHELLDPAEQERRHVEANRRRVAAGRPALPVDRRLLAALRRGLPDGSGVALGVDRLVMAALGARRIDEVIAFPIERA